MGFYNYAQFDVMKGETIVEITGMEVYSDEVIFRMASGRRFRLYHEQDCCESVSINEVIGNVDDLIGVPLLLSDEVSNDATTIMLQLEGWREEDEYGSSTWTFYHLGTIKGYVTVRWFGTSNGYYSERVDFDELAPED